MEHKNDSDKDHEKDRENEKDTEIIVNGRKRTVQGKTISFDAVVRLAFENPFQNPDTRYTVTFSKGDDKKEGSLLDGETVKIKNGMVFSVTPTTRS